MKGKETMAVKLSGTVQPKQKSNTNSNQEFKFLPKVNSFKDDQVVAIFHLLHKDNKLKLLKLDNLMKWGVQIIQIVVSFIGWCIALPVGAMSSKTRSKPW